MKTIRASEIGEYVFCHRAWWLRRVRGLASANVREMEAGTQTHARHGRQVALAGLLRALAAALALFGLLAWLGSVLSAG